MDSSKQNGAPHPKRPRAGVSGTSRALSRFNLSWRGLPAKEQVTFAFRMFGEHCARNQASPSSHVVQSDHSCSLGGLDPNPADR